MLRNHRLVPVKRSVLPRIINQSINLSINSKAYATSFAGRISWGAPGALISACTFGLNHHTKGTCDVTSCVQIVQIHVAYPSSYDHSKAEALELSFAALYWRCGIDGTVLLIFGQRTDGRIRPFNFPHRAATQKRTYPRSPSKRLSHFTSFSLHHAAMTCTSDGTVMRIQ